MPQASGLPLEEMRVAAVMSRPSSSPALVGVEHAGLRRVGRQGTRGGPCEVDAAGAQVELRVRGDAANRRSGRSRLTARRGAAIRRLALDAPVWAPAAFGIELTLARVSSDPIAPPGQSNAPLDVEHSLRASPFRFRPFPSTPSTFVDMALLVPNDLEVSRVESVIRDVEW